MKNKSSLSSLKRTRELTLAAILCAVGIIIPLFSPIKILLEPASFTLGSHVAIMIAMFVSPSVAVAVSLGTTIGFFLGGFPLVVVARAASQIVFVIAGANVLVKRPQILDQPGHALWFAIWTGIIHAILEMLVVLPFYMSNAMSTAYYEKGYFVSIVILVGIGTFVHSLVDFVVAIMVWRAVKR